MLAIACFLSGSCSISAAAAPIPKVSSKPTVSITPKAAVPVKPKPQLKLVKPLPRPRQFMRTPQQMDFTQVSSSAGYSLAVHKAYGKNPLEGLPYAEGAMLLRSGGDTLLCAVNILDPADKTSFQSTLPLPAYTGKKVFTTWQQPGPQGWQCVLSQHKDYKGDKLLLQATSMANGKTYELLYVMPLAKFTHYLPMAIYSLNSFKLNM